MYLGSKHFQTVEKAVFADICATGLVSQCWRRVHYKTRSKLKVHDAPLTTITAHYCGPHLQLFWGGMIVIVDGIFCILSPNLSSSETFILSYIQTCNARPTVDSYQ